MNVIDLLWVEERGEILGRRRAGGEMEGASLGGVW